MNHDEAIETLRPQWEGGYWAKSSGELLWAHQYAVWTVGKKLSSFSRSLTEKKRRLLELACLTHDIRKMTEKCQRRLHNGQGPGDHKLHKEDLEDYFRNKLHGRVPVADDAIQQIWDIARTHHSISENDLNVQQSVNVDLFQMLRFSDWIASMTEPNFDTIRRIQQPLGRVFKLTYFNFSRFPSPTSNLVVDLALDSYREAGWQLLTAFSSGAVLAGDIGAQIPDRAELAHKIERAVIKKSLSLQKPFPTGYTGDFLTLLSRQYPDLLMEGNQEILKRELGTVNRAVIFLKLCRDILNSRGMINEEVKDQCGLLSIVDSANSTAAHYKAKEKYEASYGDAPPAKVNQDMIDPLFDGSTIADVVPSSIVVPLDTTAPLKSASPEQLYSVLQTLAQRPDDQLTDETDVNLSDLGRYIHAALAMEEEVDFAKFASDVFERYKAYKLTSDANKGVCERCVSPVATKMQPGLNFATSPQAFSQIKPKYQYRAICPLCGYDNLVVRKDIRGNRTFVYARIETNVIDLLQNIEPLRRLVARIEAGLRYPRQLARLEEIEGCENLPFPRKLRVPVQKASDDREPVTTIRLSDRGVLLRIAMTDSNRGPKDLRFQYEPVYHVLRFLGYQVSIGTEDQDGLFGQVTEPTPANYRQSLAVILLADQLDKSSNKFVYASELLSKSPSTALSYAAGDGRERFGMGKKLVPVFLEYLTKDNVYATSRRGGLTMKSLLQDAAFLAPSLIADEADGEEDNLKVEGDEVDEETSKPKRKRRGGMWSFCEHSSDGKLTKHSATKPISQALDQLMLGRGVDFALNKFMQHLSVRVKNENAPELAEFVKGVREILKNAEELRKKNVTDFLRYKNGVLSAVFMLTRYPDLKSVLEPEKGT